MAHLLSLWKSIVSRAGFLSPCAALASLQKKCTGFLRLTGTIAEPTLRSAVAANARKCLGAFLVQASTRVVISLRVVSTDVSTTISPMPAFQYLDVRSVLQRGLGEAREYCFRLSSRRSKKDFLRNEKSP